MSRPELISGLKKKNPQLSRNDLEEIIDIFSESIQIALLNSKNIELRGFGKFTQKKTKEKSSSRNPKTGELIYVPEKIKIKFKASKKLRDFINQ